MSPNSHGTFLDLKEGTSAIIDGVPDTCDHDWNGDEVLTSANGKTIYWHTYRQWAHYDSAQRQRLIHVYHDSIDDRIIGSTVTCSKCKSPFSPPIF